MSNIESSEQSENSILNNLPEGLKGLIEDANGMDENNPQFSDGFVKLLRSYPYEINQASSSKPDGIPSS